MSELNKQLFSAIEKESYILTEEYAHIDDYTFCALANAVEKVCLKAQIDLINTIVEGKLAGVGTADYLKQQLQEQLKQLNQ